MIWKEVKIITIKTAIPEKKIKKSSILFNLELINISNVQSSKKDVCAK
jgi:hypothetical protein